MFSQRFSVCSPGIMELKTWVGEEIQACRVVVLWLLEDPFTLIGCVLLTEDSSCKKSTVVCCTNALFLFVFLHNHKILFLKKKNYSKKGCSLTGSKRSRLSQHWLPGQKPRPSCPFVSLECPTHLEDTTAPRKLFH